MEFKPTIGLEIHVELNTNSKMFCSCKNNSKEKIPNMDVCPVCMAHPGTLPVANEEAIKKVLKTGIALNCKIRGKSFFERKNYFYPDLPKGYQISQFVAPLAAKGFLEIGKKKINITRIHLEEDTGRLTHPEGTNYSLIDFNRAGVPLMELVTEPDIESGEEAREFFKELQLVLRYLGVSNADMENGQMRCEVNISLRKSQNPKSKLQNSNLKLGTKAEIKNLNSLKAVEKAIDYETKRQSEILKKGGSVVQETRGWNAKKEITFSQREKEDSHDYRYFPEPDLPSFEIKNDFLEIIAVEIPELPAERRKRFKKEYGLGGKEAEIYVSQKNLGEYFEKMASELRNWIKEKKLAVKVSEKEFKEVIKLASNYIATDLQFLLKENGNFVENFVENKLPISPENFAEFVSMIYLKQISSKIAKTLLRAMFESGQDPSQIIEDKELKLIVDDSQIKKVVQEIVGDNQKAVDDYKSGKQTALQFLIGQVMAKTKGTAKPEQAIKLLKKLLK